MQVSITPYPGNVAIGIVSKFFSVAMIGHREVPTVAAGMEGGIDVAPYQTIELVVIVKPPPAPPKEGCKPTP